MRVSCFGRNGNIRVARIARAMPFPECLRKDQSRRKRFDKAPSFTLKKTVSASLRNQLIQTGNPCDHKPISDFQVHAFALASFFFFTAPFDGFCRYPGSDRLLAGTRGSCARQRDRTASIRQNRAVGDGTHHQRSAIRIFRRAGRPGRSKPCRLFTNQSRQGAFRL